MLGFTRGFMALWALGLMGCAAIAGFDEEYSVGDTSAGGASATTGTSTAGSTGSGTAAGSGAPSGTTAGTTTAGTTTGSAGGATGAGGVGGVAGIGGSGGSAPPTWTVVDTLTVPVDGSPVVSSFSLQAGQWYRLEASGTLVTNPVQGWDADAEYYDFTNVPTSLMDTAGIVDVGIGIDDAIMDGTRTPRWGSYAASHVYTVDWQATGGPISANYHDGNHSNNVGTLTLKILALQ